MPRLSVSWVTLQRVPPDMRILTPGLRFFSSTSTRRPSSAARKAATRPAAPAPSTTTSNSAAIARAPVPPAPDDYRMTTGTGCAALPAARRDFSEETTDDDRPGRTAPRGRGLAPAGVAGPTGGIRLDEPNRRRAVRRGGAGE